MIKKETFETRLSGLVEEINKHSHTEELLNIMEEQVLDDTYFLENKDRTLH